MQRNVLVLFDEETSPDLRVLESRLGDRHGLHFRSRAAPAVTASDLAGIELIVLATCSVSESVRNTSIPIIALRPGALEAIVRPDRKTAIVAAPAEFATFDEADWDELDSALTKLLPAGEQIVDRTGPGYLPSGEPTQILTGDEYRTWVHEHVTRRFFAMLLGGFGILALLVSGVTSLYLNSKLDTAITSAIKEPVQSELRGILMSNKEIRQQIDQAVTDSTVKAQEKLKAGVETQIQEALIRPELKESIEKSIKDRIAEKKFAEELATQIAKSDEFNNAVLEQEDTFVGLVLNPIRRTLKNPNASPQQRRRALEFYVQLEKIEDQREVLSEVIAAFSYKNPDQHQSDFLAALIRAYVPSTENPKESNVAVIDSLFQKLVEMRPVPDVIKQAFTAFLARLPGENVSRMVERARAAKANPEVWRLAVAALGQIRGDAALGALVELTSSQDGEFNSLAWDVLGGLQISVGRADYSSEARLKALNTLWPQMRGSLTGDASTKLKNWRIQRHYQTLFEALRDKDRPLINVLQVRSAELNDESLAEFYALIKEESGFLEFFEERVDAGGFTSGRDLRAWSQRRSPRDSDATGEGRDSGYDAKSSQRLAVLYNILRLADKDWKDFVLTNAKVNRQDKVEIAENLLLVWAMRLEASSKEDVAVGLADQLVDHLINDPDAFSRSVFSRVLASALSLCSVEQMRTVIDKIIADPEVIRKSSTGDALQKKSGHPALISLFRRDRNSEVAFANSGRILAALTKGGQKADTTKAFLISLHEALREDVGAAAVVSGSPSAEESESRFVDPALVNLARESARHLREEAPERGLEFGLSLLDLLRRNYAGESPEKYALALEASNIPGRLHEVADSVLNDPFRAKAREQLEALRGSLTWMDDQRQILRDLTPGSETELSVDETGQIWFRLNGNPKRTYAVEIGADSSNLEGTFIVTDSFRKSALAAGVLSTETKLSYSESALEPSELSGFVYVGLRFDGVEPNTAVPLTLSEDLRPFVIEAGTAADNAAEIRAGSQYADNFQGSEAHWFRVEGEEGVTYTFQTESLGFGVDTTVGVYSGERLVASDDDGGEGDVDSLVRWESDAAGGFKVRVLNIGEGPGSYRFRLTARRPVRLAVSRDALDFKGSISVDTGITDMRMLIFPKDQNDGWLSLEIPRAGLHQLRTEGLKEPENWIRIESGRDALVRLPRFAVRNEAGSLAVTPSDVWFSSGKLSLPVKVASTGGPRAKVGLGRFTGPPIAMFVLGRDKVISSKTLKDAKLVSVAIPPGKTDLIKLELERDKTVLVLLGLGEPDAPKFNLSRSNTLEIIPGQESNGYPHWIVEGRGNYLLQLTSALKKEGRAALLQIPVGILPGTQVQPTQLALGNEYPLEFLPDAGERSVEHWFALDFVAGETYDVTTKLDTLEGYTVEGDTEITLFQGGEPIAGNDDAAGLGLGSRLVWRCPENGSYLLSVADLDYGTRYRLKVERYKVLVAANEAAGAGDTASFDVTGEKRRIEFIPGSTRGYVSVQVKEPGIYLAVIENGTVAPARSEGQAAPPVRVDPGEVADEGLDRERGQEWWYFPNPGSYPFEIRAAPGPTIFGMSRSDALSRALGSAIAIDPETAIRPDGQRIRGNDENIGLVLLSGEEGQEVDVPVQISASTGVVVSVIFRDRSSEVRLSLEDGKGQKLKPRNDAGEARQSWTVPGPGTYRLSAAQPLKAAAQFFVVASRAPYDGFELGDRVLLGRHELVAGSRDWTDSMDRYVGKEARIVELLGTDSSGSYFVEVDVDGREHKWRTRSMRLVAGRSGADPP